VIKRERWRFLKFNFKGTPSQEKHETLLHSYMISSMTLTEKSEFKKIFLFRKAKKAPKCIVDHLVGGTRVGLWWKQKLIFPIFEKIVFSKICIRK
jgi:hypothetical protein